MLDLFKKIINKTSEALASEEGRESKLKIATCVILLEAASADSELTEEELHKIIGILKARFQMTDSSVDELIEASRLEREKSTDLWYFTHLINQNLSNEEKYELMEMVWSVIYSDGTLDKFENYIAHKLLNLLNLDHSKFIEIKLRVKNNS
ncbi:MAG TPA: TerB family tellurite resistance protein [Thermodesulfobacteriota bacterium]|nr:TerB family tellurite resistance protein [Thermodesulfobacteriota bacterium]